MIVTLKEIATISAGQNAPQGDEKYYENGIPFVKAGNLQELIDGKSLNDIQKVSYEVAEEYKLKLFKEGTILFAKSGMSCMKGLVYVLPRDSYVVSHLACVTPNSSLSDYLKYYFLYNRPNHLVKDSAYPSISLADIGDIEIELCSLKEREKIVNQLKKLEQVIKLNKLSIKKYDDLIKARFVEMFGDPIDNSKKLVTVSLKDVLALKAGDFTEASNIFEEPSNSHPYPCYGGNGIRGFVPEYNQVGEYSLIGRQGALSGNVQYATGKFKNTEHALLVTPLVQMNSIWLNQLLINLDLKRYQTGAAQPGISVKNLQEIQIIMVPITEQNRFADFVQQVDKSKFIQMNSTI